MSMRSLRLSLPSGGVLALQVVLSIPAVPAAAQSPNAGGAQQLPTVLITTPRPPGDTQSSPPADMFLSPSGVSSPGRGDLSTAAAALPAASTTIDAKVIERTPVSSYGDIFRAMPGFNVSNYGQGAIGYGMSLRGYTDGEHGRDIAYFIDGVPVNEVSSIHTPNYADLNYLIPETVKSVEVIRGPFSVEYGDSNLGGSVNIVTKRAEPFASLAGSGGSQGTGRALATYSSTGGSIDPYIVAEGYHTDGYRDNSFINRYNSFNKLTFPVAPDAVLSLRMQAYGTTFGSPSYISRDAVASGALSPRAAINSSDGGNKYLENLVASYTSGPTGQEFDGTFYVSHHISNRYADFGTARGQRWQQDERTMVGGRLRKVWTGDVAGTLPVQVLVGGNWRTDFIEDLQGYTVERNLPGPLAADIGVDQTNLASFAQVQVKPLSWLKLTGGGRYDQFYYDVTDRLNAANSTSISPGVWSPKGGVSIVPVSWLEFYANYGQGFRSIDATLELIGNPGIQPFKIESKEAGVQLRFARFSFLVDAWTTHSDNESFQAAPTLPVTFLGQARREGFDLDGRFWVVKDRRNDVALFANYGGVRAKLLDSAPSYYVPNVPNYVANVGVDFDVAMPREHRLSGSAYVSFIGRKNLTQDGLITTSPYSRVTGRLAYSLPDGWSMFGQATWYPGDRLSELAINFGDVVNASSSDIRTSPQAELTLLAGLTWRTPTFALAAMPTSKMVVK